MTGSISRSETNAYIRDLLVYGGTGSLVVLLIPLLVPEQFQLLSLISIFILSAIYSIKAIMFGSSGFFLQLSPTRAPRESESSVEKEGHLDPIYYFTIGVLTAGGILLVFVF